MDCFSTLTALAVSRVDTGVSRRAAVGVLAVRPPRRAAPLPLVARLRECNEYRAGEYGLLLAARLATARVFCLLNGRDLTYTVDEAEDLMLSAASGHLDVPRIAAWIVAHSATAS